MTRLNNKSQEKVADFLKYNISVIMLLLSPLVIGGSLIAKDAITLVFGELYENSVVPLILLLFYVLVMSLNITLANFILVINADKVYMKILSIGAVTNVLCNIILIPLYGAIGAALSMVLSETVISSYLVVIIKRYVEKIFDYKFMSMVIADCLFMSMVIYIIQVILGLSVVLALVVGMLGYIVVFLLNYKKPYVRRIFVYDKG
mgnify:CR=1 FL=1